MFCGGQLLHSVTDTACLGVPHPHTPYALPPSTFTLQASLLASQPHTHTALQASGEHGSANTANRPYAIPLTHSLTQSAKPKKIFPSKKKVNSYWQPSGVAVGPCKHWGNMALRVTLRQLLPGFLSLAIFFVSCNSYYPGKR